MAAHQLTAEVKGRYSQSLQMTQVDHADGTATRTIEGRYSKCVSQWTFDGKKWHYDGILVPGPYDPK